jgi:hypothetical protein
MMRSGMLADWDRGGNLHLHGMSNSGARCQATIRGGFGSAPTAGTGTQSLLGMVARDMLYYILYYFAHSR